MTRPRIANRTFWLAAAAYMLLYAVLVTLDATRATAETTLNVLAPALTLACAPAAVRATVGKARIGWFAIAAGFAFWVLGEAIYSAIRDATGPTPIASDASYLAGYAFLTAGLVGVLRLSGWRHAGRWLLDAGILAVSIGTVLWFVVLGPSLGGSADAGSVASAAVFPLWDLSLLAILVVAASTNRLTLTPPVALLLSAVAIIIVLDVEYLYWAARGDGDYPLHVELGWLLVCAVFARAFLVAGDAHPVEKFSQLAMRARRLAGVASYLAIAPVLAIVAAHAVREDHELLDIGAVSLIGALVIARQYLTLRENRRLTVSLRAENQLRERLLRAQSDLGQAILVVDGRRIATGNDAALKLTARTEPQLRSLRSAVYLLPRRERLRLRDADPAAGRLETCLLRPCGATIDVELSWTRLEGEPARTMVTFRDLRAIREDAAARIRAEKAESLGRLAGGIAHDFNNLLTTVTSNASLARRELDPSSPVTPYLQDIEAAGQRAGALARSLLSYAGRDTIEPRPTDLNPMIEELVRLARAAMPPGVDVSVSLDPVLPPVLGDAAALSQVVMNLLMNAGDALSERGHSVQVSTRPFDPAQPLPAVVTPALPLDPASAYVALTVSDDGPGVDPATSLRMFDPFFSTKSTGRGLGLTSVLGIVTSHRGRVMVDSAPGAGASFTVILPVASVVTAPDSHSAVPRPDTWSMSGTVIVADDNAPVRMATARILESLGMTVLLAADGRDAFRLAEEHPETALAVLDVVMPVMSGPQAFRHIRALRPDLPILLVSGYDEDNAARSLAGEPHSGFLPKPYRVEQLAEAIRAIAPPPAVPA